MLSDILSLGFTRVARGDNQIFGLVGDSLLLVDAEFEEAGNHNGRALPEQVFGDGDAFVAGLREHYGIDEEGRHSGTEIVGDGKAGDFAILAVEIVGI